MVDLSICIVNHRTPELTRACLNAIAATHGALSIEVFLVNNTADVCDVSDIALPLILIQNAQPLGFAANQNQMMRRASGQVLLVLNSDTEIQPGALQTLVQFLHAHPRCGMAGPRLHYADGRLQPSARNFPNFSTTFLETSGLWRVMRGNPLASRLLFLCNPHTQTMPVDWLTGACLAVRRETYTQVGGFDEALFPRMYGEDLEWCWRIKQAGWHINFVANATVVHLESQSPLDNRAIEMWRGSLAFYKRHYTALQWLGVRLGALMGIAPRWLFAPTPTARAIYAQAAKLYWA